MKEKLGIRWNWMVPLYPSCYTPQGREPYIHWTGSWVSPGTSLDDVAKKKMLPLHEWNLGTSSPYHSCYTIWATLAPIIVGGNIYFRQWNRKNSLCRSCIPRFLKTLGAICFSWDISLNKFALSWGRGWCFLDDMDIKWLLWKEISFRDLNLPSCYKITFNSVTLSIK